MVQNLELFSKNHKMNLRVQSNDNEHHLVTCRNLPDPLLVLMLARFVGVCSRTMQKLVPKTGHQNTSTCEAGLHRLSVP